MMLRRTLASFLTILGWVGWIVCGFGGLGLCLATLHAVTGYPGVALGFLLSPITFLATPWYALAAFGDWTPVLVCYAGGLASTALIGIGAGFRD